MTSTRSPRVLGFLSAVLPIYYAVDGDYSPSPAEETVISTRFLLNITTKLTVFGPQGPGRSVLFRKSFSQRLDALVGGMARDAVAGMLSEVHFPETPQSVSLVNDILKYGRGLADGRPTCRSCVMCIDVSVDALVDELPTPPDSFDVERIEIGDEAELGTFDDYIVRFEPASEESIVGLEKVRVLEKAVNCRVCLHDVSVGSEAIRMPCSHLYHGDCIVEWLRNSKFCPLCWFEMPS